MSFPSRYACLAAASLAVIVAGQQSKATLILNDPILIGTTPTAGQYAVNPKRLTNQSPVPTVLGMAATGWTGGTGTSQPETVDLSLDVPSAVYESGGKIQFDGSPLDGQSRANSRNITTPYASTGANGPLYISGIFSTDAFTTPSTTVPRGYALMSFSNAIAADATTGTMAGYFFGFKANANDSIDLIIRHRPVAGGVTDTVILPNANPATAYQLILRADVNVVSGNQETVTYWVNPTDVSSEAAATTTALATNSFNDLSLQNATSDISRIGVSTKNWDVNSYFDEFRMGTAFADVTVPEPASMTVLAAPAFLALRRRRSC